MGSRDKVDPVQAMQAWAAIQWINYWCLQIYDSNVSSREVCPQCPLNTRQRGLPIRSECFGEDKISLFLSWIELRFLGCLARSLFIYPWVVKGYIPECGRRGGIVIERGINVKEQNKQPHLIDKGYPLEILLSTTSDCAIIFLLVFCCERNE